jgi:hypothetical protein
MSDPYKPGVAESKYGNKIAPSPTISEKEAFQLKKTTLVVKYVSINAEAARKVYCGLRSRMESFTRSWDKYKERPRFFSVQ